MSKLLVDGTNLLFRGYHAISSRYNNYNNVSENTDDTPVPVDIPVEVFVTSFLQSLKNYVVKFEPKEVYLAWDKKLLHPSTNFRKDAVKVDYKGGRDPEIAKKVFASEAVITPIVESLGVKIMYPRVMEADDVIAWLAHKFVNDKVTIVSADGDLAQLITANCCFYQPLKDVKVTPETFEKHFLVPQDYFLKYKALLGDSDNINGIDGFGKKKAKEGALDWNNTLSKLTDEEQKLVALYITLMDLTYGYNVHPEEVVAYQEQYDKLITHGTDFKKFGLLVEEHKLTQIKYQIEKWRGIFNKSTTLGAAPLNSYLKNLFS